MNKLKAEKSDFDALVIQDARVFKAGNSLAIRIPSVIAKRCELEDGAAVQMAVENGVISVRRAPSSDLASLLGRITPENVHAATFEDITGAERW